MGGILISGLSVSLTSVNITNCCVTENTLAIQSELNNGSFSGLWLDVPSCERLAA
jgi:hypothetical protein